MGVVLKTVYSGFGALALIGKYFHTPKKLQDSMTELMPKYDVEYTVFLVLSLITHCISFANHEFNIVLLRKNNMFTLLGKCIFI